MVLFKYLTLPSLHVWPQGDVHHCWLSLCGTRFFSLITLEVFIVIGVLEKTLESLLNCKEIKPVNPKGNQTWIFIGRTDAETEAPTLWPPNVKSWFIGKDPDAGKDGRQKEKGEAEDEMARQHHQLNGHEFEQTQGDSEGQESLACWSPWGRKESDMT